jgi:hypothetical protein
LLDEGCWYVDCFTEELKFIPKIRFELSKKDSKQRKSITRKVRFYPGNCPLGVNL